MRKQHLTNAINTILKTNKEVTIRVKDNSYLFLERAGQLVFDALHKEGYKICTYDGQVQVMEELGVDLPKESKKYTIKDLKKGKVGIEYKGDLKRLTKLLKKCFPSDSEPKGTLKYYYKRSESIQEWSGSNFEPSYIKVWVSENDIKL